MGFPIRKSRDQWLVSTYPGLIAAAHVLLRLLAPRHPPCALILLIDEEHLIKMPLWSFQGARGPDVRQRNNRLEGRSLKTQQRGHVEVDVLLGELGYRTSKLIDEPSAYRSESSGFPRKEVIQPQLPLRLPCYDFTPITNPTFDGSLPCGLGHRLRVLPAFVV
jgi:hypothetical protein